MASVNMYTITQNEDQQKRETEDFLSELLKHVYSKNRFGDLFDELLHKTSCETLREASVHITVIIDHFSKHARVLDGHSLPRTEWLQTIERRDSWVEARNRIIDVLIYWRGYNFTPGKAGGTRQTDQPTETGKN